MDKKDIIARILQSVKFQLERNIDENAYLAETSQQILDETLDREYMNNETRIYAEKMGNEVNALSVNR